MKLIMPVVLAILLIQVGVTLAGEPFSARVQGMGGAGVVIPKDATTIFWNPSGLMHHDGLAMDVTLEFESLDWPGNWGVSYLNYNRYTSQGFGLGIYRLKSLPGANTAGGNAVATILTAVYRTPIGIPVGLSFKYLNERWGEEDRRNLFTADAGFLIPLGPWLTGVNFQSVTGPDSHFLPYRVLAGLGWSYRETITLASQIMIHDWGEVENWNGEADLRFGLELAFSRSFSLQGGWAQRPGEKYLTGGLGIASADGRNRINLAYHWHPSGVVDDRVFFSLGYYL
jgi:hypothetical protein